MTTHVEYLDYDSMLIGKVRMDIACERYKTLEPKFRTVVVDGVETKEFYLEIKTVDDRMVYELVQDVDQKELASLIRVLQTLNRQIVNGDVGEKSNSCIK